MPRRKSEPKVQPQQPTEGVTPEQIKAVIDAQDWVWQARLFQLLLSDPNSQTGQKILALFAAPQVHIARLEEAAGLAPGDIDPEGLLQRDESLKRAAKRLGKGTNAVKQARHRAKERMTKLKATMPVVTMQGGHVAEVTEQP
jgi:hypothetical protein